MFTHAQSALLEVVSRAIMRISSSKKSAHAVRPSKTIPLMGFHKNFMTCSTRTPQLHVVFINTPRLSSDISLLPGTAVAYLL